MNIRQIIVDTCNKCAVPDLASNIKYKFNRRFTSKLGLARYFGHSKSGEVIFSLPLWERATEQEKNTVIVHEVCHIITFYLYNGLYKIQPHGHEWQRLMLKCGLTPTRCHSVNRDGLARKLPVVQAACSCMTHQITINRATRMNKGKKYKCIKCQQLITLVK